MKLAELKEFVEIDIEETERTLANIEALRASIGGRSPSVHEMAAFGAYVRDVYTGLENILVRFAKFQNVSVPDTANWHLSLIRMFSQPPASGLPHLLTDELLAQITDYRGFRHVFNKRYSAHLDWDKLRPLVEHAAITFRNFNARVTNTIAALADSDAED